jgi:hypothetical protein
MEFIFCGRNAYCNIMYNTDEKNFLKKIKITESMK